MSGVTASMTAMKPSLSIARSPATARKTSEKPAKGSKFVTPEILEEKYYNRDTGLFMIHKLTSQEAQNVKAKIEPGIKETQGKSEGKANRLAKSKRMGKEEWGEEQRQRYVRHRTTVIWER